MPRHIYSPARNIHETLSRLTQRDHIIIGLLAEHGVLTTGQLRRACFSSPTRAQTRLLALYRLGVIERFRSRLLPGAGSEEWHYTIAPLGARLYAAATDQPPPRPARVTEAAMRLASNPHLAHRLAVNDFFVRILDTIRHDTDRALTEWIGENSAAAQCAGRVRPDAAATYTHHHREIAFYFEHDRGTESLHVLAHKVHRYADAAILGPSRPVLFELTSPARETNLHQYWAKQRPTIAVATTHTAISTDPTARVWRPPGHRGRMSLADLAKSVE